MQPACSDLFRSGPSWRSARAKARRNFFAEIETELLQHSRSPAEQSVSWPPLRRIRAYADSIARKRPGDAQGYSIGRANFEFLIRERLGFDWTLPEAMANGERLVDQMSYRLEREAARHGSKNAKSILEEAAAQWTPRRPLLEEYRHATSAIKDKLADLASRRSRAAKRSKFCPLRPF